eukprot:674510-Pyramimonas_sp.AAC.1
MSCHMLATMGVPDTVPLFVLTCVNSPFNVEISWHIQLRVGIAWRPYRMLPSRRAQIFITIQS